MAEEKKAVVKQENKPAKKAEASKMDKFISWCKKLPSRTAKPFKNMFYELKKVSWPSKRKLIVYSVTVLLFMVFMGVVIGLLDMGASALVKLLIV